MGRAMTPINVAVLQGIINEIERDSDFVSHMPLFNKCAEIYNSRINPTKKLTGSVVYLRYKDGKITTNVQSRGKGQHLKGRVLTEEHKAAIINGRKNAKGSRKSKITDHHKEAITKEFSDFPGLAERIINGSVTAAVKAKCIDCCCRNREAIRECASFDCPLHPFRPYQTREKNPTPVDDSARQPVDLTV